MTLSEKQTVFVNSLLDSAYRYEKLKPVLFNLQHAYTHQGKQVQDLQVALQLSRTQVDITSAKIAQVQIDTKKKTRRSFFKGALQGIIIGVAAGIFLIK